MNMIRLISDYNIKGRALVVPIEGNGIFMANLSKYTLQNSLAILTLKMLSERMS